MDPHLYSPFSSSILSEVWKKAMLSLNEQHNSKTASAKHKGYCVAARCAHIEALSDCLKGIEKERLISNDTAEKVLKDLNKVIKRKFPGISVTLYGSYSCDLAVSTSNLNFALQTNCSIKNPILFEIRKCLAKELTKYDVLPFDEEMSVRKSKICFIEPYTRVACEMMYLGKHTEHVHKMSGFLKALCSFDHRIKTLFIAARIWAEVCSIHESEDGKLPPVAFNLMVVYFLQQLEKPLLP
ncbi:Terminal uridylyltransferase 7, partial [Stegodyphus mimosarum]